MLGRLRMTTEEALKAYNSLASEIFSRNNRKMAIQDGLFKATTLEKKVKELVAHKQEGEFMLAPNEPKMGKAFVCAMPAKNLAYPRRFRTYPVRELASANCMIWEAARATTAAPTFFKRIAISEEGRAKEEFVDGGLRCNNPSVQVLEEARNIFGDDRKISCLVSIGTGHPGTIGLSKPDSFQKILPTKLIGVLKAIATDCESTAHGLRSRFKQFPNFYFRFNVTHGAGSVSLKEWEKMSDVETHTKAYMEEVTISASIDAVVKLLCTCGTDGFTIGNISQY
jgi:predicted acylesterase/phospholipase RssA